ncbi:N-acetylglucosaminidase [Bacillus norwichensis]|uniref:SH3-like domain-containing protein n=1 Tax=Bacillus norwichensis TaxID=2762217 RepID=A0ABR8VHS2_9BACI|nr:SH3 domain-containing protein [Bacillus norwichensis]MBD8004293.1 SH3-like domain-containing protein [Bacillus norwichensis]
MKKLSAIFLIMLIFFSYPSPLHAEVAKGTQSTVEKKISKLGHINNSKVKIYSNLQLKSFKTAGSKFTNQVYYIKKQATIKKEIYYLISNQPSDTKGVFGWVKAKDMSTRQHKGVDKKKKTLYVKGTGKAFSKAWGGKKDYVYNNLSKYKNRSFQVHLTEKVGNNLWYRGTLDGKTVWILGSDVVQAKESKTSKLGHIKNSKVRIYKTLGSPSSIAAGSTYTNFVYYIKKQSIINGTTYYLISKQQSDTKGTIGWVNEKDLSIRLHKHLDNSKKDLYIKGTGSAYSKIWGGRKELVYSDLKQHTDKVFKINLAEKVDNDVWYRGTLNSKTVWIHSSKLKESKNTSTQNNMTLKEAVDIQMKQKPQTDKYRDKNAFVHKDYIKIEKSGEIIGNEIALRTSPKLGDNVHTTLKNKTKVMILDTVTGDQSEGTNKWYKIKYNNKELYVESSLVDLKSTTASATSNVDVMESANTNSHVYATLGKGTEVIIVNEGETWHEIQLGTWRNAKASDVEQYLSPNNNSQYQHLLLSSSAGVSAAELNKVLAGKGILDGLGKAFLDGGTKHKVNEIYLISHAFLETGQGTSQLAEGIEVGKDQEGKAVLVTSENRKSLKEIKKVYNMFGIKAYDSCPNTCGAEHAYEKGWDTPSKAIIGGAEFIGKQYIHNEYKQNTIYKMRWNFANPSKQYATDVGWAVKQTSRIESIYKQLDHTNLEFDIPKFK